MEQVREQFDDFLDNAFDNGLYATDDVIAFVMPLFEEVLGFHEAGQVAPFDVDKALFITNGRADIDESKSHKAYTNFNALEKMFAGIRASNFDIVGADKMESDIDEGYSTYESRHIHLKNEAATFPAFVRGYKCFEMDAGHHDEQTDIFCLGLVLGSMALGFNLYDDDDIKSFVQYRANPVQYNPRVHPTLSGLITEMTELDRHKRSQDLYDIIHRLKNYRDYNPDRQADLSMTGVHTKGISSRSEFILNKLSNRLFDNSRRNRLLYYKPNARFVNLTVSSVPMVLHYQSIRPELLFTWNSEISKIVSGAKEVVLNKYLRFEDHAYLPSSLDKIRVESQRDVQEFGFSQLKLVIAFLNWHNLKEDYKERIQSPLLLVPVELTKTKRLKEDHYHLNILSSEAEVNPVLANQMKELYGITLPDYIDLAEVSPLQFYELVKAQITAANQGIQLQLIDRPKIKLVHTVARHTIANYRKRLRRASGTFNSYKEIPYSYRSENYNPLGLAIFKQRIEPRHTFLEYLVNDDIKLTNDITGDGTKERSMYELAGSDSNPYSWDFDLCNIVLGNFNYKKMSLVRDYNQVMEQGIQHDVFDELFSSQPRRQHEHFPDLNNPFDWYHVITADPTQTKAILQSRTGTSYIIQGPPGTGKSQTITNLIADYLALEKNVLFVCEKRAALDVVFHRLGQNGLDELCCYIHDSQGDKRAFIKNLKDTYEDFSKNKMDLHGLQLQRKGLLERMEVELSVLQNYHRVLGSDNTNAGMPAYQLQQRIAEIKQHIIALQANEEELLPDYKEWVQFGKDVSALGDALEESGASPVFAEHPLSALHETVFTGESPLNLISGLSESAKKVLTQIEEIKGQNNLDEKFAGTLAKLKELVQDATLLLPLAETGNLRVVNKSNKEAKELDKQMKALDKLKKDAEKTEKANANWLSKFDRTDLPTAIEIAEKHEGSFFSFFSGSWRRLKNQMQSAYNFNAHQVRPTVKSLLQNLQNEYAAIDEQEAYKKSLDSQYNVDNISTVYLGVEVLRNKSEDAELDYLLSKENADKTVVNLYKASNLLHQAELSLQQFIHGYENRPISELQDDVENITLNTGSLRDLLPALRSYAAMPQKLKTTLQSLPLSPAQTEAAIAQKTLSGIYRQNSMVAKTDAIALQHAIDAIKELYSQMLKLNAEFIRAKARDRFQLNVDISNTAISQLNADQREFKKKYSEGRKILENEFGKSIRYKSIRELCTKESGEVLKDIKPVWLMSPLSVSDSLPIDSNFFDVVIFDEASQITLEEGVPALYRAPQAIIVGDDKQMPPTNFFTAKMEDPDDLEQFGDENEDEILSSDADSLLVQGSRKLNSTMLKWHYRSRYETLISYSNHAFYGAELLTIPDRAIHAKSHGVIEITDKADAVANADKLYDRSISYHYLPKAVYEKRQNKDEATYIAHMVRELLQRNVPESIAIVAFSQEQQMAIEDELESLASTDKNFELLLEKAYDRTEDGQFVGLIVKNLENIQGDERDIIIMSVCYGFDADRRIIMNFGPINKKGGEKRLNVLFSRAKKHIAVVSSIKYTNITNEYNEGANYFRRFLQYAENVSTGNMDTARVILDGLVLRKQSAGAAVNHTTILQQIKTALQAKGYVAEEQIGQSGFKCSLALKKNKEDDQYTLAVLLDDAGHYANDNVLEQYYQRPAVMQAFGWKVAQVYGKDWLEDPERVLEFIVKKFNESKSAPVVETKVEKLKESVDAPVIPPAMPENKFSDAGYSHLKFERYEMTDEKSNKFWEAATDGNKFLVRFGKCGTKGQLQLKTFATAEKAAEEMEKMVRDKVSKGYVKI